MKKKLKRMRGGSKRKSLVSTTSFDPLNILLLGVLIFIGYHMFANMNSHKPHVIYKEIIICIIKYYKIYPWT